MSFISRVRDLIETMKKPQCPLCGGSSTYSVAGLIDYAKLMDELKTRESWLKAHGLLAKGIPQFPSEHAVQIRMPGFTSPAKGDPQADENAHRRCTTCHSLLPPEFRDPEAGSRGFAITVAGFTQTGKTTWLLNMLNPTYDDTYEIVRRSKWLQTRSYEYAEPATLAVLRDGARTVIPFFLFGTSILYSTGLIHVRTLDIMGERFLGEYIPETSSIIQRHLSMNVEKGALLVLDKFTSRLSDDPASTQPPQKLDNIARVYEEIPLTSSVWKGVVWTHLDQAQWNDDGEAWLRNNLPDQADVLLRLVAAMRGGGFSLADLIPQLDRIDARLVWSLTGAAINFSRLESGETFYGFYAKKLDIPPLSSIEAEYPNENAQESLIFLLLRLQMAYSLKAARHGTGKHDYLNKGGRAIFDGILLLARSLYVLWDAPLGNFNQLIKQEDSFDVLPCGLVAGRSIWSDLILIRAIEGSGVY